MLFTSSKLFHFKLPIILMLNFRIFISGETVSLKTYEATHEGYIQSWVDRFQGHQVHEILENIWEDDKKYYPSLIN